MGQVSQSTPACLTHKLPQLYEGKRGTVLYVLPLKFYYYYYCYLVVGQEATAGVSLNPSGHLLFPGNAHSPLGFNSGPARHALPLGPKAT